MISWGANSRHVELQMKLICSLDVHLSLTNMSFKSALNAMQIPIQWVLWHFLRGVKRQMRESSHLPPSSADVKYDGAMSPFPQYVFVA
jgi:hypothetical protein